MKPAASQVPGVSIEVADLVAVRGHLSGLSLNNIRRRASYRSGVRDARIHGRGMEYEESRAYVAGDDVKTIDWRVMARTGEAYTKIFSEEKERRFLLAADLSASMFFGTRYGFKSWACAHTAAHVGWLASFAGERIGGLIVSPESHYEIRPEKTRSGLLAVFHYLAQAGNIVLPPAVSSSRLNYLLGELNRVLKPGSIVALISDFIGVDNQSQEILSAIAKHSDINAYWIHDETEVNTWPAGYYQVLAGRQKIGFDLTGIETDSWLSERQQEHRSQIETLTSRCNIPLFPISCNSDITPQVVQNLAI